jgi:ABC-type bacteriocin/lantibiotic exporter with double-glycine peptidase domain
MTRRLFVPEVVQASAMDCGPASLKCLLEGFGVPVSYGRLREACQTDVDGTSIDTLEEVAAQLGLAAEQIMLPLDHLLLPEAQTLPAIVVVRLPNGVTHFQVVWRRHGNLLQCMDPATGRRWITRQTFLDEVYVHKTRVPTEAWREWAATPTAQGAFRGRLQNLGVNGKNLLNAALTDSTWRSLAQLDAATRLVQSILESGGIRPGRQCRKLLDRFCQDDTKIPSDYWSVRPAEHEGELQLKGAVLLHVSGRLPKSSLSADTVSPEIAAALSEKPARPERELLHLLRADGVLSPTLLLFTSLLAAGGVILEAILFRGLFDLSRELGLSGQRLAAVGAFLLLLLVLLFLEFPVIASLLRMGRRLETRLRQAFLEKIPRLSDRYFQSRLMSDMTERSHMIHRIRHLPELGGQLVRSALELILTAVGIVWLDPALAPLAAVAALAAIVLPLLAQPVVIERDLRVRTHSGALSRYYLDSLLGLVPIQVHGAQRAVRREHRELLTGWASAGLGLQTVAVWFEALQFALGFGLAAWMLFSHLAHSAEAGAVLLLIYWALNLPVLGQDIAQIAWQYPAYRNRTLRLLEPLGALEEEHPINETGAPSLSRTLRQGGDVPPAASDAADSPQSIADSPVAVHLDNVTIRAAGHTILHNITTKIPAGSHVAIVGPSGAGKSSLVGLLLGWWRSTQGQVLIDGVPIAQCLEDLRRHTAWVDPAVQLWNRSFIDNIRYGSPDSDTAIASEEQPASMMQVLDAAELRRVLERLPDGFETRLGEGGALVSGGEGQRVRLARGLLRPGTRMVVLDEPFRGLDRGQRRSLLQRVRAVWQDVTLLCITHDVSETMGFERVLLIEDGAIVEDGSPAGLATDSASRYRALLDAEIALQKTMWSGEAWRRLYLDNATLTEAASGGPIKLPTEFQS